MTDTNIWLAIGFGLVVASIIKFCHWCKRRREAADVILELLADGQEWAGLDLILASGGRLSRGVVYVDLRRLEDRGLITSRISNWKTHGIQRRLYRLAPRRGQVPPKAPPPPPAPRKAN